MVRLFVSSELFSRKKKKEKEKKSHLHGSFLGKFIFKRWFGTLVWREWTPGGIVDVKFISRKGLKVYFVALVLSSLRITNPRHTGGLLV